MIGDRIARIQVKAAKWIPQRGAVQFATSSRSRTGDRKHYYGRSELIVAYCDPIGEFFAIEPQEAPPSSVRLRVRPSANGQRDGVRPADDYRLADRMQRMVHIFGSIPLVDLDDVGGRRRRRGVDPLMISCRLDLLPTRPSTLDGTRGSESLTPQPST